MPDDDNELVNLFLDGNGTEHELIQILSNFTEVSFLAHTEAIARKDPKTITSGEWLQFLRCHGWSNEGPFSDGGGTTTGTGTTSGGGTTGNGGGKN